MTCLPIPQPAMTQMSRTFNHADADRLYKSREHVVFRVHEKFLGVNTGRFPRPEPNRGITLPESVFTLDYLFRFIYPTPPPALDDVPFSIILELALAANKYQVYHAIQPCEMQLKRHLPAHTLDIFIYAGRCSRSELIEEAGAILIRTSLEDLKGKLNANVMPVLESYQKLWRGICEDAQSQRAELIKRMLAESERFELISPTGPVPLPPIASWYPPDKEASVFLDKPTPESDCINRCRSCGGRLSTKGPLSQPIDIDFLTRLDEQSLQSWTCCAEMVRTYLKPWFDDIRSKKLNVPSLTTLLHNLYANN